ncbi:unnamed protein product, partial [Mesorhabditis spiculigera]
MTITPKTELPSDEELTVSQEITLSTPWLKAVAPYMAKSCEKTINEYMLRRRELEDPRAVLKEGRAVTDCGIQFLLALKKDCKTETDSLGQCIDQSSAKLYISHCRKEQKVLDACVQKYLNIERPALGYFSSPHVHESKAEFVPPVQRDYRAEAAKVLNELPSDYHLRKDYKKYNDWKVNMWES